MGVIVGCSYHLHHNNTTNNTTYNTTNNTTYTTIMFQLLMPTLLLVQSAYSLPQYAAPAPAYKAVEKPLPPQPYTYQYGVADDYSKANFRKAESQDEGGNVQGEYTIALPDGRIQRTKYTADPLNQLVAMVMLARLSLLDQPIRLEGDKS